MQFSEPRLALAVALDKSLFFIFLAVASYGLLAAQLGYSGMCSDHAEVLDDVEGIVHDEPVDSVLQVGLEHAPAVHDLLILRVVVVLNLKLVHVVAAHCVARVEVLQEALLAEHVECSAFPGGLHFQFEVLQLLLCELAAELQSIYE